MTSNDEEPCITDIELTGEGIRIDTKHTKDELVIRWLDQADDRAE